ncbi:MAG: TRAP transporter small permease [Planctomycetota bacterium]|nr:MAG: TRAP transporter small permease [Planctomycetota bacterium]
MEKQEKKRTFAPPTGYGKKWGTLLLLALFGAVLGMLGGFYLDRWEGNLPSRLYLYEVYREKSREKLSLYRMGESVLGQKQFVHLALQEKKGEKYRYQLYPSGKTQPIGELWRASKQRESADSLFLLSPGPTSNSALLLEYQRTGQKLGPAVQKTVVWKGKTLWKKNKEIRLTKSPFLDTITLPYQIYLFWNELYWAKWGIYVGIFLVFAGLAISWERIYQDARNIVQGLCSLDRWICSLELGVVFILLFAMIGLGFYQIFHLSVLKFTSVWAEKGAGLLAKLDENVFLGKVLLYLTVFLLLVSIFEGISLRRWKACVPPLLVVLVLHALYGMLCLGIERPHFSLWMAKLHSSAKGWMESTWIPEILKIMVMWVGLLGASIATFKGQHISIEVLPRLGGLTWRRWLNIGIGAVAALCCYHFTLASVEYLRISISTRTLSGFELPPLGIVLAGWQVRLILPIVFALLTWRFALMALGYLFQVGPWQRLEWEYQQEKGGFAASAAENMEGKTEFFPISEATTHFSLPGKGLSNEPRAAQREDATKLEVPPPQEDATKLEVLPGPGDATKLEVDGIVLSDENETKLEVSESTPTRERSALLETRLRIEEDREDENLTTWEIPSPPPLEEDSYSEEPQEEE